MIRFLALLALIFAISPTWAAETGSVRLATTTSTENSGLLNHLVPLFEAETGLSVDVVAVGTGQALELGRRGDADTLLVHHRAGEEAFVAAGHGADRRDVMFNDFIIVGPADDPAGVRSTSAALDAFRLIAEAQVPFLSRGDDSGTHRKELDLWGGAGISPDPGGGWYRESGAGMGRTLNTAVQMGAYTLTDRGTWLSFENPQDHVILLQTDPPLDNPYSSIRVTSPALPERNRARAATWHEWLTGPAGQAAIDAYRVNGQQLFFASARPAHSN